MPTKSKRRPADVYERWTMDVDQTTADLTAAAHEAITGRTSLVISKRRSAGLCMILGAQLLIRCDGSIEKARETLEGINAK